MGWGEEEEDLTVNGLAQDDKPPSQSGVRKEEKATVKRKLPSRTKISELVHLKTKILPMNKMMLSSLR